ncbi:hydrolase [Paraburkholderia caballeronis]|uniref:Nicotinamidase-related amidase n=1 Tax=Paraburkholderia caballeronis TaxID=416943 RepID=A0A1H7L5J7_9BURK|nr:hydrolase [Paraburkholderia caballeronis]PXW28293.1 nicotinamidase-related amidase [Paraburkholderia caballeronis]PXX03659.1 nicotinamidase-related amidase [Paraburkholderia caballeronis]RAK04403.1 nicotinamidase-related amidase [Paraburkholderia caballeronis]SED81613.1 Nicotinamidase-related amidase [Paraburkholderia caballeronis]SEK93976.1 Nicotinamidase-related amidase [Paraburkholderia caballeronis]
MAHELLTPDTCALALVDHQPQMFFGVNSHERTVVLHNAQILAKAAKLFNVPTILSTIAADSFSGHLLPEIQSILPHVEPIDRTSMNAWEDTAFRKAVEATGRKKIVLAGLWTEVCVAFPTVQMIAAGYEIYVATDACGDITPEAHERAVQRVVQLGAVPINSLQFMMELQRDWARSETYDGCMEIFKAHSAYGIGVRYAKQILGEHASEAGR